MYLENIRADRSRTLQDRNLAAKWYKKYAALSLEEIEALFDPCKGNEKKYRNLKRALGWFLLGGAAGATAVILWE
ncbi:hypothetical protein KFU94_41670 [Chloroflexi bacterium TSY]|nr:hypothetical protein [Chloroflexi bacterium TSY]